MEHRTDPTEHPSWCARPTNEHEEQIHLGRRVACNPTGRELIGVYVQAYQHWPLPGHGDVPPAIGLIIVEDSIEQWYPLPARQARALAFVLRSQLRQVGAFR